MTEVTEITPIEQLLERSAAKRRLTVGMPAARGHVVRLPLTPEGAAMLTSRDIDVRVEAGAGAPIHYTDGRYARAGAKVGSRAEALGADIVLLPGALPDEADARQVRRGALVLTLMAAVLQSPRAMAVLLERHVIVMALDLVKDVNGHTPFADLLDEIDGRAAMTAAASMLADAQSGKGILLGGIPGIVPCEVTVIGAGRGGIAAARIALGLGATVRIFDTDIYSLRDAVHRLGSGVVSSAMHPHVVVNALRSADVVIAGPTGVPHTIDADVVAQMKEGVRTIALEATGMRAGAPPVFPSMPLANLAVQPFPAKSRAQERDSQRRICYFNAAGTVPRTVAMAISDAMVTMFDDIVSCGAGMSNTLKLHPGMQRAVCTFLGKPVNERLARLLGLRSVDISLLLSYS